MTATRVEFLVRYPGPVGASAADEEELCHTEHERDRLVGWLRRRGERTGVDVRIETYQRTVTVGEWEPMDVPTPI